MIDDDVVTIAIPRSALTVVQRPRCVTQRTCLDVLGLPPRDFLALCRQFASAGGDVAHAGRLRLIELDPFIEWLSRRGRAAPAAAPLDPVDTLAAELGLATVPPLRPADAAASRRIAARLRAERGS